MYDVSHGLAGAAPLRAPVHLPSLKSQQSSRVANLSTHAISLSLCSHLHASLMSFVTRSVCKHFLPFQTLYVNRVLTKNSNLSEISTNFAELFAKILHIYEKDDNFCGFFSPLTI